MQSLITDDWVRPTPVHWSTLPNKNIQKHSNWTYAIVRLPWNAGHINLYESEGRAVICAGLSETNFYLRRPYGEGVKNTWRKLCQMVVGKLDVQDLPLLEANPEGFIRRRIERRYLRPRKRRTDDVIGSKRGNPDTIFWFWAILAP